MRKDPAAIRMDEWDRAWLVRYLDGYNEPCVVVYAPHPRAAKILGVLLLNEYGAAWEDCEVERAARYDTYWPSGPTLREGLEIFGWKYECTCGHYVTGDGCGHCKGPPVFDEATGAVWCNQACRDTYEGAVLRMRQEADARRQEGCPS